MFSKNQKVVVVESFDKLKVGRKGTVLVGQTYHDDWVGCKFPSFTHGHDLIDGVPAGSREAYWVPASKLALKAPYVPKVGDWVRMTERHDAAEKGMVGIIRHIRPESETHQGLSVQFPGWTGGHDLYICSDSFKLERPCNQEGQFVPASKVEKARKPYKKRAAKVAEPETTPYIPKVGDHIEMTGDYCEALKGFSGTIIQMPSGSSKNYAVRFPGMSKGHACGGLLPYESTEGHWVPASSFKVDRKAPEAPKAPKVEAPKPTQTVLMAIKAEGELKESVRFDVRLKVGVTTQDGYSVGPGMYLAQAVLISGRPTVCISFGKGRVLIFEADDERLEAVDKR